MSKSNAFELAWLQHVFLNAALAGIGDTSGLQPAATTGSLYVSCHTADPAEGGNQTSFETTVGGYARIAVARTTGGWTVTTGQVVNAALVSFAQGVSGSQTLTHFGVGTLLTGTGLLLYSGALQTQWVYTTGVTPEFQAGTLIITED